MPVEDRCYYDDSLLCGGALWRCNTCGESFCQTHYHSTAKGCCVECVGCEQQRLDKAAKAAAALKPARPCGRCEVCDYYLTEVDVDDDGCTIPAECCERTGLCAFCRDDPGKHDCDK